MLRLMVTQEVVEPRPVGDKSVRETAGGGHRRSSLIRPARSGPTHPCRPPPDNSFGPTLSSRSPACMPSVPNFSPSPCPGSVISRRGTDVKKREKVKEICPQGHAVLYMSPYLINDCSLGCFIATDCVLQVVYLSPHTDSGELKKLTLQYLSWYIGLELKLERVTQGQNGVAELIYAVRAAVPHMDSSGQPCRQQHQTVDSGSNEPHRTTDTSRLAP